MNTFVSPLECLGICCQGLCYIIVCNPKLGGRIISVNIPHALIFIFGSAITSPDITSLFVREATNVTQFPTLKLPGTRHVRHSE